jgi:hypothetical protein
MKWQPIETAPKEESVFCYHPMMGRFIAFQKCIDREYAAYVWETWDGESGITPPTHWMPLPEPPGW